MNTSNYRSDLSADEKTLIAIVRAAESFKRAASAIFRKHALSFPQYNILRVLKASTNGQSRITEVSRIMLVPGANMTSTAKRLEKNGFLVRKSDKNDERVTLLEITPKGKKSLVQIEKEQGRLWQLILQDFSQQESEDLLAKLKKIIKNSRETL